MKRPPRAFFFLFLTDSVLLFSCFFIVWFVLRNTLSLNAVLWFFVCVLVLDLLTTVLSFKVIGLYLLKEGIQLKTGFIDGNLRTTIVPYRLVKSASIEQDFIHEAFNLVAIRINFTKQHLLPSWRIVGIGPEVARDIVKAIRARA